MEEMSQIGKWWKKLLLMIEEWEVGKVEKLMKMELVGKAESREDLPLPYNKT